MNIKKQFFFLLIFSLVFLGCVNTKKFVYFNDINKTTGADTITNFQSIKIQPGDVLQITATTIDREITTLLNPTATNTTAPGYLVDTTGNIELPLAGKIFVKGKSLPEIDEAIKSALSKSVKNVFVSTRLLNFRISVLGAVARAGSFNITSDRVSVLDALSMAGDVSGSARFDDVMLIREIGGIRRHVSLDLNDSKTMSSPYYYLRNNDVIYVKPAANKLFTNTTVFQLLPTLFGTISLILVIYTTLRR